MRSVCLLGTSPNGVEGPFADKSWEIWGCSYREQYVTRADRWFETHSFRTENPEWSKDWLSKLGNFSKDCELWMHYPELKKGAIQYPVEEIENRFGKYFLTSTFAWMAALALHEGVDRLTVAGVDMEHREEYRDQRAGAFHFIHLARHMGVEVTIPQTSGLAFEPTPYPAWQDDPLIAKVDWRLEVLKRDQDRLGDELKNLQTRYHQLAAVHLEYQDHAKDAPGKEKRMAELASELHRLEALIPDKTVELKQCEGSLRATQWQRNYLKP